jgi:transcriptional regulator of NAD metabolism
MPLSDMSEFADNFMIFSLNFPRILFLHIREPEEIEKAVKKFEEYNAKTILVKRDSVKHITSNMADENVFNYDYDIVINNNGSLEDLRNKVVCFFNDFLNDDLKKGY